MGKRLFVLLVALMLVLSLSACSPGDDPGVDPNDADPGVGADLDAENNLGDDVQGDVETAVAGKFTVGFDQNFPQWVSLAMTESLQGLIWNWQLRWLTAWG